MIPTPKQIETLARFITPFTPDWEGALTAAFTKYEEIRPKEDASQLQRTNHALAAELKEARDKIAGHEAHSKDWSPLVSYIQSTKYGVAGECCFAVALRQLKAFETELAGIKADCALAESHYERAERSLQESQSELAALGAQYHDRGDELKEARRLIANLQDLLQRTLPPAPAPKPTAEELEEKEIKTAFLFAGSGTQSLDSFTAGWKARAAKGGSEA